ncbi:MAG TPA: 50S ribosomal protein L3 [Verrucomicrobia bacterium]|nr:MAG: 50S ribosomal protein L3 [Lentisphaerae bacterium GWF2_57_35]HBA83549.1 50S ribosomal protein L3 [Verrucomicrobiota bacterium]
MQGLIGKKIGMTRVFDAQGQQIPVTVVQVGPCVVVQRKTRATDGYEAVQLGFEEQKEQRVNKPRLGQFKKAGVKPQRILQEVVVDEGDEIKVGDIVKASIFEGVTHVDVIGVTKGRGFQGVIKRHRMAGGPAAHGSGFHRRGGSIGCREWPARIFKNKRMPGHMGNSSITTQNLKVVAVRNEDDVILVRGAVMGPTGGIVLIRKAIKKAAKAS